jgi:chromosome segregation ATPase
MRNVQIQIQVETSAAEENLESFEGDLEKVEGAADQVGEATAQAGGATDKATEQMASGADEAAADVGQSADRMEEELVEVSQAASRTGGRMDEFSGKAKTMRSSASAAANNLGFELVQATQDAKFGLAGVANQLPFMAEQFDQLRQRTGSTQGAISSLVSSFTNPATGLIAGITLLLTFKDDLLAFFTESGEAAKKTGERYQEAADSLLSITSPVEDQEIELGLEAARQTATELENELQRVNETISNLQSEPGMHAAVQGVRPTSPQTERRIEALKERRQKLEEGLQVIQNRIGQIEAELALQEELEKVTGETAENREKGTKTTEERTQAFNGLAVTAQEAAKNMETIDRFFQQREQERSLFEPIQFPEVPSVGETMLQDIGPVQERLDDVQQILGSAGDKAAQIDMSTFLSDSAKTERKLSLAQSKLQKMSGQGIPLTEARFSAVAETIGLSAEEAETLRKRILGTADAGEQAQIRLSEVQKEVRKTQQQLVKGQASPQKLIDQLDKAGRRLQQFGLGTQLDATRMKIQQVTATLRRMRQQGVDPTAQRVQNLKNKLRGLRQQAAHMRIAQQAGLQAAQAGFRKLGKVIAGVKSEMEALKDVTSTVLQSLGSALLKGAIAGPLGAPFAIAGGAMLAGGSAIQSFESGGETETPVQLVGEQGPELVSLPTGSRVADHESSKEIIRMIERASEGRDPQQSQPIVTPTVSAKVGRVARQGTDGSLTTGGTQNIVDLMDQLLNENGGVTDSYSRGGEVRSGSNTAHASQPAIA